MHAETSSASSLPNLQERADQGNPQAQQQMRDLGVRDAYAQLREAVRSNPGDFRARQQAATFAAANAKSLARTVDALDPKGAA